MIPVASTTHCTQSLKPKHILQPQTKRKTSKNSQTGRWPDKKYLQSVREVKEKYGSTGK
jgi:hypothetical protein